MSHETIELVIYSAKPGVPNQTVRQAAERMNLFLRRCPGYIRRELAYAPDTQQWIDIVRWVDREAALVAAADFHTAPEAAALIDAVQIERMTMLHGERVLVDQPGLAGLGQNPARWDGPSIVTIPLSPRPPA